jgi:hypothetical protein
MSPEEVFLEQIIKEEYEKLLNEFVVPVGFSLSKWKQFRKKHNTTNAQYHKKHPRRKWKVVHGHKEGHIGEPLKGMGRMSYRKATRAHAAIAMRNEQLTPTGISTMDTSGANAAQVKQNQNIDKILSTPAAKMSLKQVVSPEQLEILIKKIIDSIMSLNQGKLTKGEALKVSKSLTAQGI